MQGLHVVGSILGYVLPYLGVILSRALKLVPARSCLGTVRTRTKPSTSLRAARSSRTRSPASSKTSTRTYACTCLIVLAAHPSTPTAQRLPRDGNRDVCWARSYTNGALEPRPNQPIAQFAGFVSVPELECTAVAATGISERRLWHLPIVYEYANVRRHPN